MPMRILPAILIATFLAGSVTWAKDAKVQVTQSTWTKIKEVFK